jgi:phenylpropionate dioxygenase-like ring-hydroxylating dioxygenase large terminal subunit
LKLALTRQGKRRKRRGASICLSDARHLRKRIDTAFHAVPQSIAHLAPKERDVFVRNAWYVAAWADQLGEQVLARRICNDPVVLFRQKDGKVAALEDRCCHRAAPLQYGQVVRRGLQCGYHGLVFDGTGQCVHIPWQEQIPADARVRSYPVMEKDALIWI